MINKPSLLILAPFLIVATALGIASAQSGKEAEGRAAEQSGRLREALTHYVAALQSAPEGSADDQRLREVIIKLAQRLTPPPAVPEEARRFSVRGQIAIKEAKSPSDFDEAAKEFGKALRTAPWWADGYVNQAVALEKAGKFSEAIRSLKFYLLAAPAARDTDKIKEQIYALEYRQKKAGKEAVAKREEQERKRREEQAKASDPARLAGDWCYLHPSGEVWCDGNHRRTIRVTGASFEIWEETLQGRRIAFRGTIQGEDLNGSYSPSIFRVSNCPDQLMLMQGKITSGGNRIELSYTQVAGHTRACVVTSTRPDRMVLVRKPGY
jgi:tetratricopeptide (TPR) repeat protein